MENPDISPKWSWPAPQPRPGQIPTGEDKSLTVSKPMTSNITLLYNTVKNICVWNVLNATTGGLPFTHNMKVTLDGSLHLIQKTRNTQLVLCYTSGQFRLLSIKSGADEWSKSELNTFWDKYNLPSDTKNGEVLRYRITIQIIDNNPTVKKYVREPNIPPKLVDDYPGGVGGDYPLSTQYLDFFQITMCFPNIHAVQNWSMAQAEAFLKAKDL